jgi:protein gp37
MKMADKSKIEWTDATWNPITGCEIVSPGCIHCYAMKLAGGRLRNHPSRKDLTTRAKNGSIVWSGEVRFNEGWIDQPKEWHAPRRIFVCAHGDLFYEAVPNEWIDRVFSVMGQCSHHTFQVLTKRPTRMRDYIERVWSARKGTEPAIEGFANGKRYVLGPYKFHDETEWKGWPLPNVHLGVSCERQQEADERIPILLKTPAAVRFISAEPLIGPIDLWNGDPDPRLGGHKATRTLLGDWWEPGDDPKGPSRHGVDWVIVGGESGPGARHMDPDWMRSLRDQCAAAGVPFFAKQMAHKAPIPPDLMVRQYAGGDSEERVQDQGNRNADPAHDV